MLPSPDILKNFPEGKFVLANLAAKRAKQLREGAPPLVSIDSNHPLTIALAEIAAGKIKAILPSVDEMGRIEQPEMAVLPDELAPEFGMLLPALDESEVALVETIGEDDHDGDHDSDGDSDDSAEPVSLSDLVEGTDDEIETEPSDDDTLSLSDIADQETGEEEESESD
ncbi:MAG: DNA-directed RNA polymerase subunit omega [Fimbriimonadaceae bacterium]|nr:DNA-directed RNA polymerase subunit omega [Fimbriimonadaceae bacterium]